MDLKLSPSVYQKKAFTFLPSFLVVKSNPQKRSTDRLTSFAPRNPHRLPLCRRRGRRAGRTARAGATAHGFSSKQALLGPIVWTKNLLKPMFFH